MHVSTEINTFTFYKRVGGNSPPPPPEGIEMKKMEAFLFNIKYYIQGGLDSRVRMLIQFPAGGGGPGIIFL